MTQSFRFVSVFAAVAAVLYVVAMEVNWAAFTYHPRLVEFGWGAEPSRNGPAMYWYGWITTATFGGIVAGAIAAIAPWRGDKFWPLIGWLVPAGAMAASVYFMIPFFTR